MCEPEGRDTQKLESEIDEAACRVADVTSRILNALDPELRDSGANPSDVKVLLEQAEKSQLERRGTLEAEHERRKQKLARKWKRY